MASTLRGPVQIALRLTKEEVDFEVTLRVRGQGGRVSEVSLARIRRTGDEEAAMLGLGLAEGKQIVARLRRAIVLRQFEATTQRARDCAQCGEAQSIRTTTGRGFAVCSVTSICECRGM